MKSLFIINIRLSWITVVAVIVLFFFISACNMPPRRGRRKLGPKSSVTFYKGETMEKEKEKEGEDKSEEEHIDKPGDQGKDKPGEQGKDKPGEQGMDKPGEKGKHNPGEHGKDKPGEQGKDKPVEDNPLVISEDEGTSQVVVEVVQVCSSFTCIYSSEMYVLFIHFE